MSRSLSDQAPTDPSRPADHIEQDEPDTITSPTLGPVEWLRWGWRQLTSMRTAILLLASTVLMIVFIGFLTYGLVIVVATVIHVIGAVKANNGEWWTPPLTPQLVK